MKKNINTTCSASSTGDFDARKQLIMEDGCLVCAEDMAKVTKRVAGSHHPIQVADRTKEGGLFVNNGGKGFDTMAGFPVGLVSHEHGNQDDNSPIVAGENSCVAKLWMKCSLPFI